MLKPSLQIKVFNRSFPAFLFFGILGYLAGAGLGIGLTLLKGLDIWITLLLSLVSATTFLGLVWGVKQIKGEEDIVYYHHEIGILITCTLTLWIIGAPILAYLDIVLLGIGTLLAFGRWGCFSVGCCHGRPCDCKVSAVYSKEHADAGFPRYYIGVKLFPLPLLESLWVFVTVLGCIVITLGNFPAGTTIVVYTVFYGIARFGFEFYRGDPERPYWGPFSEAQWTTLVLVILTVFLGWTDLLPYYIWHLGAGVLLGLLVVVYLTIFFIRPNSVQRLLNPREVEKLATELSFFEGLAPFNQNQPKAIPIIETSLGLQLSKGVIQTVDEQIVHYSVSKIETKEKGIIPQNQTLNQPIVKTLANLIQTLKHRQNPYDIQSNDNGIFHILFKLKPQDKESRK